jgi:hypothetical protein
MHNYNYIIPDFDELIEFTPDENYLILIRNIQEAILNPSKFCSNLQNILAEEKHFVIMGLNQLRRLQKFYQTTFNLIYDNLYNKIFSLICLTNVSIQKCVIRLISEIFSQNQNLEILRRTVKLFCPILLNKISSENDSMKNESKNALFSLSQNVIFYFTLETLLDCVSNQNNLISKNAFDFLKIFLSRLSVNQLKFCLRQINWKFTIVVLFNIIEIKKESYLNRAVYVYKYFDESLTLLFNISLEIISKNCLELIPLLSKIKDEVKKLDEINVRKEFRNKNEERRMKIKSDKQKLNTCINFNL